MPTAFSFVPGRTIPLSGVSLNASAAVSLYGGNTSWTQFVAASLAYFGELPSSPPDFLSQPALPAQLALSSAPLSLGAEFWALRGGAVQRPTLRAE